MDICPGIEDRRDQKAYHRLWHIRNGIYCLYKLIYCHDDIMRRAWKAIELMVRHSCGVHMCYPVWYATNLFLIVWRKINIDHIAYFNILKFEFQPDFAFSHHAATIIILGLSSLTRPNLSKNSLSPSTVLHSPRRWYRLPPSPLRFLLLVREIACSIDILCRRARWPLPKCKGQSLEMWTRIPNTD